MKLKTSEWDQLKHNYWEFFFPFHTFSQFSHKSLPHLPSLPQKTSLFQTGMWRTCFSHQLGALIASWWHRYCQHLTAEVFLARFAFCFVAFLHNTSLLLTKKPFYWHTHYREELSLASVIRALVTNCSGKWYEEIVLVGISFLLGLFRS